MISVNVVLRKRLDLTRKRNDSMLPYVNIGMIMNKPFKKLTDQKWTGISSQVLKFVISHTTVLQNDIFWNLVEWQDVVSSSPALQEFLSRNSLDVRNASVIYIDQKDAAFNRKIHVDIDKAKIILFPLLNCGGSRTVFYDVDDSELQIEWQENNSDLRYLGVGQGAYREIGSFTLDCPVAMDTGIPHAVHVDSSAIFPRVSFAMRFNNSIDHMF